MLKNELVIYFPSKEYFVQEEIKGYAELKIPYTLEINQASLKFFGMEQVNYKGKSSTNVFYEKEYILVGPGSKDRGYDWLGRRKKQSETLKSGIHQYPFSFTLPTHLPPSMETNEAKIRYVIEVTIEAGNSKMTDLVSASIVKVAGSIFDLNFIGNNNNPVTVKESKTFFMTAKAVDISIHLESKVFIPGDNIKVKFGLDNQTSKTLSKMTLSLVQKTEYWKDGYLLDEKDETLGVVPLGGLNGYEQKFPTQQLLVPTTAYESLGENTMDGKKTGKCVRFIHSLMFYAEVSGLIGSEIKIPVPIYLCKTAKQTQTVTESLNRMSSAPSFTDYHVESFQQQEVQPSLQQQPQQNPQYVQPQQYMQQPQQPQYIQPQVYQQPQQQVYQQPQQQYVPMYETQQLYPSLDVQQEGVQKKIPPPIPNELKQPQYDEFFK